VGAPLAVALTEADCAAHLARCGVDTRPATRDDLAFAFATLRDAMRDYVEAAYGPWDDAQQHALFAPSFDLRTHRIVREGGDDVGVLAVEVHVDRVHLGRIFLAPGAQRRGLGARLVGALLEWSHAHGLPVVLTVLRSNPAATRFYERLGFRAVGETSTHLHLEAPPETSPRNR
jgi:GNAT superfamily N-acetyltransferase